MVIVRESPRKAAAQPNQAWPPKSPLAALLSSPSGRKRYESRLRRESVSPTPAKRRKLDERQDESTMDVEHSESEDDEDEETLKLKLAAIEAKLKIKKLQNAKAKENRQATENDASTTGTRGRSGSVEPKPSENGTRLHEQTLQEFREVDKSPSAKVVIPVSPVRNRRLPSPDSPARVLLGIDKGMRAQDVSLKRPASAKLLASASLQSITGSSHDLPKPRSFAERIAESRTAMKETQAKQDRIRSARSEGFKSIPCASMQDRRSETQQRKQRAASPAESARIKTNHSELTSAATINNEADKAATLEPYSGFHLSKRNIDHSNLTRHLVGKELYSIPRLLKEVVGPDYDPPDCEADYVVLGIVASKSMPLDHKSGPPKTINSAGSDAHARTKFMVLKLTDLKWEIDLFLFNTGFDTFWRISPGTVVAVLNPGIMPPKDRATGAFSLKLASSEDVLIEIGTAADLKFCSAIKADGKQCTQWIDGRKTEVCEFHMALKVSKARKGRMEFNTMVGGATKSSAGAARGQGRGGGRGGGRGRGRGRDNGLLPEGKTYDAGLHETLYLAPQELGFSATRLLDDADADVNAWQRGMSREEMQRKRQRAREKERDLASKLGALGASAGSEYLRKASTPASRSAMSAMEQITSSATIAQAPSAKELGLLDNKATDVVFTATSKRKSLAAEFSEPMGWGGARKSGLLLGGKLVKSQTQSAGTLHSATVETSLKSAQRNVNETSPKKKARFMLEEKGLRIPGRESTGEAMTTQQTSSQPMVEAEDSDELEII